MTDTAKLIRDYNFLASGVAPENPLHPEEYEAITNLALDPINLSEYPAVTDLDFAGAR